MPEKKKYTSEEEIKKLKYHAEKIIDSEYVDRKIEELKKTLEKLEEDKYVYEEVKRNRISSLYVKIRRKIEKYSPLLKYALPSIGISLAYYFLVDRIFDNFAIISLPDDLYRSNKFIMEKHLKDSGFNYVEIIPESIEKEINMALKYIMSRNESIQFPIYFTLLNPMFSQLTALVSSSLATWYLSKRRRYTLSLFTSLAIGVTLYTLTAIPIFIAQTIVLFNTLLSSPMTYFLVPKIIADLIFQIYNPNPIVSLRNVSIVFYSFISSLITTIISLWKRRRDIINMYNL